MIKLLILLLLQLDLDPLRLIAGLYGRRLGGVNYDLSGLSGGCLLVAAPSLEFRHETQRF